MIPFQKFMDKKIMQNILITGCSSGIGLQTALTLKIIITKFMPI